MYPIARIGKLREMGEKKAKLLQFFTLSPLMFPHTNSDLHNDAYGEKLDILNILNE